MCHFVKECKFFIFFFSCLMCPTQFRNISFQVILVLLSLLRFLLLLFGFFLGHPFHTACSYPKFRCHTLNRPNEGGVDDF